MGSLREVLGLEVEENTSSTLKRRTLNNCPWSLGSSHPQMFASDPLYGRRGRGLLSNLAQGILSLFCYVLCQRRNEFPSNQQLVVLADPIPKPVSGDQGTLLNICTTFRQGLMESKSVLQGIVFYHF